MKFVAKSDASKFHSKNTVNFRFHGVCVWGGDHPASSLHDKLGQNISALILYHYSKVA